ncbi:hypothetical protein ACLWBD_08715 [Bdellovibrio sp. HCB117]|uniref:hypothetical protein n=1 Tax=Bdellovibrio sp. HCB117 TaxID=3394359 RepID=UPI0039B63F1F
MNLKKKISLSIGMTFSFLFVGMAFQNCAEQTDFASLEAAMPEGHSIDTPNSKAESAIDGAPTDAKQTLESMMSLLDLKPNEINQAEVNAEVNYRRNLLASQNDIALVNSPAIIAMTSLAAVVCKQAVNKEKKGTRDIFKFIDFTKGPSSYGKLGALNTYITMVDRFWMRKPTSEELALFSKTIDEYYSTLNSTAMGNAAETDKLAIFICSGMLSVPESYLL